MKPLPAVGLTSSIVQLIDFSIKLLQKEHRIYHANDADIPENHVILQQIAHNLYRLSLRIDQTDLKRLHVGTKGAKLSEAAQHLLKLSDETKELTNPLIDAVLQAQAKGSYGDPTWNTAREALLTVWKKKDITGLKKKLRAVRKEVDSALLLALRQYLDQSAETGLPVFSTEDSRIHHWERWQNEAMDAIHANDWKPKNKKHAEEWSKQVNSLIQAEDEAHFRNAIFSNLHFSAMDDRLQSIATPLDGTFEWIFDEKQPPDDSLLEWLGNTSGQNLFWVTGKPGSGKSTFMKYLFRNSRIYPSLEAWSDLSPGITSGFFFWSCGTHLQRTPLGLLRTLLYESLQDMLYGPLEQDPAIMQCLFEERWHQFTSHGGGLQKFDFADLRRAFELMVSDASKKYFFIIDGLDELEDYSSELIDLILSATKRGNVKICASSRPSPIFQNAFEKRPRLTLDHHTESDIQAFISSAMAKNDTLVNLHDEQSNDATKKRFVATTMEKASGAFLWVTLALDFLAQSVQGADFPSLQARLESLPSDLDGLLSQIFQNYEQDDLEQAALLFKLIDAHGYPNILELSFAIDRDTDSSLTAEIAPLSSSDINKRIDDMNNLLNHQCKRLLTIFETPPLNEDDPDLPNNDLNPNHLKINYTHRCIHDFVQTGPIQTRLGQALPGSSSSSTSEPFNPDAHWANSSLHTLKTLPHPPPPTSTYTPSSPLKIWHPLSWCLEYALRLETASASQKQPQQPTVRLTYLNQVSHAAISSRKPLLPSTTDLPPSPPTLHSFLDLAVWLNLSGYVAIKASSAAADKKEIRHAVEYAREMRKRLGSGGEEPWIGGEDGGGCGRRRLKAVYRRPSPGMEALLEYYGRAVRFGVGRPGVEVPEGV